MGVLLGVLKLCINCLVSCFQMIPVTLIRQMNFAGTLYCNEIFYVRFSLRILSDCIFNLHCLLFIIQNLFYTTSYISTKRFSVGCFLELH